jgi:hypothetical protein
MPDGPKWFRHQRNPGSGPYLQEPVLSALERQLTGPRVLVVYQHPTGPSPRGPHVSSLQPQARHAVRPVTPLGVPADGSGPGIVAATAGPCDGGAECRVRCCPGNPSDLASPATSVRHCRIGGVLGRRWWVAALQGGRAIHTGSVCRDWDLTVYPNVHCSSSCVGGRVWRTQYLTTATTALPGSD